MIQRDKPESVFTIPNNDVVIINEPTFIEWCDMPDESKKRYCQIFTPNHAI